MRIFIDEKARNLVERLKSKYGDLFFYQGFGCCEGSAILCYAASDFKLGPNDVCLAKNDDGLALWTHSSQVPLYEGKDFYISTKLGNSNEYSLEFGLGESFDCNYK